MSTRPWRVVTQGPIRSAASERGPRSPIGGLRTGEGNTYALTDTPFGNRGDSSGSEQYGWRVHLGQFTWTDGTPPAPIGIVCDENWQPIPFADVPAAAFPIGGYTRAEMKDRVAFAADRRIRQEPTT